MGLILYVEHESCNPNQFAESYPSSVIGGTLFRAALASLLLPAVPNVEVPLLGSAEWQLLYSHPFVFLSDELIHRMRIV